MIAEGYSKATSASGVELEAKCARAHWLRYHDDEKDEEEIEWETIAGFTYSNEYRGWVPDDGSDWTPDADGVLRPDVVVSTRQRSTALGKAVHARVERYFRGGDLGDDYPARVALSGLHLIPHPSECEVAIIEEPSEYRGIPGTPDLVVKTYTTVATLADGTEVQTPGRWILIDHKTCRDFTITTREGEVIECQKSAETLRKDRQCCRYAAGVMRRYGLTELECRWVYYRTDPDQKREARATVFVITLEEAEAVVDEMVKSVERIAKRFALPLVWDEVPGNPEACPKFGGCAYHVEKGGKCAQRRSRASVRSRPATKPNRREKQMADTSNEAFEKAMGAEGIEIPKDFKKRLELKREWAASLESGGEAKTEAKEEPKAEPEAKKEEAPKAEAAPKTETKKEEKPKAPPKSEAKKEEPKPSTDAFAFVSVNLSGFCFSGNVPEGFARELAHQLTKFAGVAA